MRDTSYSRVNRFFYNDGSSAYTIERRIKDRALIISRKSNNDRSHKRASYVRFMLYLLHAHTIKLGDVMY